MSFSSQSLMRRASAFAHSTKPSRLMGHLASRLRRLLPSPAASLLPRPNRFSPDVAAHVISCPALSAQRVRPPLQWMCSHRRRLPPSTRQSRRLPSSPSCFAGRPRRLSQLIPASSPSPSTRQSRRVARTGKNMIAALAAYAASCRRARCCDARLALADYRFRIAHLWTPSL